MSITIPTTELVGCIADVLPIILDPKHSATAGVVIEWDGESLHFAAYDTYAAGQVTWTPGEGAEADVDEDSPEDFDWGGDDTPWRVFIWYADAKEIIKLFKLPAKLWRFPVTIKVNDTGSKLVVERDDMARGERLLTIGTENKVPHSVPRVAEVVSKVIEGVGSAQNSAAYSGARLGSFGGVRPHGTMTLTFGRTDEPTAVQIGSRFIGFVYPAKAQVRPYSLLRDGAGVVAS